MQLAKILLSSDIEVQIKLPDSGQESRLLISIFVKSDYQICEY